MGLAAGQGHLRTRTGPRDDALREARVCYNHLAGARGIAMYDAMLAQGHLMETGDEVTLTATGAAFVTDFGVDLDSLQKSRAVLCRSCLDWSARRTHLSGSLGRAMLARMEELGWASRSSDSRAVVFTAKGRAAFDAQFALQD